MRPSSHASFSSPECPLKEKPQRNPFPCLTMLGVIRERSGWNVDAQDRRYKSWKSVCDESKSELFELEEM